jgi:hypothetical protein
VVAGKEWHKDCYYQRNSSSQQTSKFNLSSHNEHNQLEPKRLALGVQTISIVERCFGCSEEIIDSEKIIVSGKEWHKTCYQIRIETREFGMFL